MRKGALFYILTNLSNVWLNRRQLDSLICFSSPSVALITSGKNSTAHSQENESEKGKRWPCIVRRIVLTSQSPGKGGDSGGPWAMLENRGHTLR